MLRCANKGSYKDDDGNDPQGNIWDNESSLLLSCKEGVDMQTSSPSCLACTLQGSCASQLIHRRCYCFPHRLAETRI